MKPTARFFHIFSARILLCLVTAALISLLLPHPAGTTDIPSSRNSTTTVSDRASIQPPPVWPYDRDTIRQGLRSLFDRWGEATLAVDEELVRHVSYFFKYYTIIDRHGTNTIIGRSRKFYPEIRKIFRKYDLPEELAFAIPFVESAFVNKARSDKKATGMFQFLTRTARAFNLKVSGNIDERMDYRKSAAACAVYLSQNRDTFDSTVLSLGSFHHGTSRLTKVLRNLPVLEDDRRDFVSIFNHRRLGKYSKEYIPKCLAVALIYRFLDQMELEEIPEMESDHRKLPRFVYVKDLKKEYPDILRLNPDLQKAKTTYLYATTRGYFLVEDISFTGSDAAVLVARTEPEPPPPPSPGDMDETASEEKPVAPSVPDAAVTAEPEEEPAVAVVEESGGGKEISPAVEAPAPEATGKTETVPMLVGREWDENIHDLYGDRKIVMNESYTGVIDEIGVIYDQNLKSGEEWSAEDVLILEVGRTPVPEDELSPEEYTEFIREYMSRLRKRG